VPVVLVVDIVDDGSVAVVSVDRVPLLRLVEVLEGRSGGLLALGTDNSVETVESVPVRAGAEPTRGVDDDRDGDETLVELIIVVVDVSVTVGGGTVVVSAVSLLTVEVSAVAVVSVVVVSVFWQPASIARVQPRAAIVLKVFIPSLLPIARTAQSLPGGLPSRP
jgi:hypothetical protein